MNKKSQNHNKIRIDELLELFNNSPEEAYRQLISSNYFFSKQAKLFWAAFDQIRIDRLNNLFPKSTETFNKVVWLKLFFDLNEFYNNEKEKSLIKLIELNPHPKELIKSFFLCLELGETNGELIDFPNYSEDSLRAIKLLLYEISPKLTLKNPSDFSTSLVELSNNLIKYQVDISLLDEFLDAFVWGGFEMEQKEEDKGFLLGLKDINNKEKNLYGLNFLKTKLKREYKRSDSNPKVSNEEHFKKNDPKWKTNEGLVGILHSSGVIVTDQTPGITSLQIDDSIFSDFNSTDYKKSENVLVKMMSIQQEQNFHCQFRNALSEIYQPNDEIDIHKIEIEIEPNIKVTLFDLVCAMSSLIANADMFRYFSGIPDNGTVKAIKNNYLNFLCNEKPELSLVDRHRVCNSKIVNSFAEIEKQLGEKTFRFFSEEILISWLILVEELKHKSLNELKAILKLFSKLNSPLSFNPIYKVGEEFYFSWRTCSEFNVNRMLYDKYISDKLFNHINKPKEEHKKIGELHKNRADQFANSVRDLIKTLTPYSEANKDFYSINANFKNGKVSGDFDTIAYFEKENIVLAIQIKLSNVMPKNEKRKQQWIDTRIKDSGVMQVSKDLKLLQTEEGLKLLKNKLKIRKRIKNPVIYSIIITDNFFTDHKKFILEDGKSIFYCISYFEFKHLILNQKIHEKQQNWLPFVKDKAAYQLIKSIENNVFWSFVNELANEFTFSKTLSAINEKNRIEMKI